MRIERDSVCAGDDCDAPHSQEFILDEGETLAAVTARVLDSRYLASIQGGEATWVLHGLRPLAVIAQQWTAPRFLVPENVPAQRYFNQGKEANLFFEYRLQKDPEAVYLALAAGGAGVSPA